MNFHEEVADFTTPCNHRRPMISAASSTLLTPPGSIRSDDITNMSMDDDDSAEEALLMMNRGYVPPAFDHLPTSPRSAASAASRQYLNIPSSSPSSLLRTPLYLQDMTMMMEAGGGGSIAAALSSNNMLPPCIERSPSDDSQVSSSSSNGMIASSSATASQAGHKRCHGKVAVGGRPTHRRTPTLFM